MPPTTTKKRFDSMIKNVTDYFTQVQQALASVDAEAVSDLIQRLLEVNERDGFVYVCGNGGSAATASHFVNDLSKSTVVPGQKRFRALALTDNVPLITAWANDTSYDNVFSEQLRGLVRANDLVIAISGSGNSPNVLKAIEAAAEVGATTVGWSGFNGGKLAKLVDLSIDIPCDVMEQIEDVHLSLAHNVCTHLRIIMREKLVNLAFANALVETY